MTKSPAGSDGSARWTWPTRRVGAREGKRVGEAKQVLSIGAQGSEDEELEHGVDNAVGSDKVSTSGAKLASDPVSP